MATQLLNDKEIQAFITRVKRGEEKPLTKKSDGGGLFLTVTPGGKVGWRLRYTLGGKEQLFTRGAYPTVPLPAARLERGRLQQQLLDDPKNLAAVRQDKRRLSVENSGN